MHFTLARVNELPKVGCVYELQFSDADGINSYIGQTQDLRTRIKKHIDDLEGGKHKNRNLQAKWNSQAIKNVEIYVRDQVPSSLTGIAKQLWLLSREDHWIECRRSGQYKLMNQESAFLVETADSIKEYRERISAFLKKELPEIKKILTKRNKQSRVALQTLEKRRAEIYTAIRQIDNLISRNTGLKTVVLFWNKYEDVSGHRVALVNQKKALEEIKEEISEQKAKCKREWKERRYVEWFGLPEDMKQYSTARDEKTSNDGNRTRRYEYKIAQAQSDAEDYEDDEDFDEDDDAIDNSLVR